jgi:antitoxin (DNA-binding transcriptional repressor) of toxin-antitoxin stability system
MGRHRRNHVTASEAAKKFGALVDRVREERAVYVVERGGRPVAQIGPVSTGSCTLAQLADWLRARPALDDAYLDDVERAASAFNVPAVPGDPWER